MGKEIKLIRLAIIMAFAIFVAGLLYMAYQDYQEAHHHEWVVREMPFSFECGGLVYSNDVAEYLGVEKLTPEYHFYGYIEEIKYCKTCDEAWIYSDSAMSGPFKKKVPKELVLVIEKMIIEKEIWIENREAELGRQIEEAIK